MQKHIKTTLALLISLITGFTWHTVAQVGTEPVPVTRKVLALQAGINTDAETPTANYIFETIDVPGVDFLEVTASNDLGHYAGNTRGPDGQKTIGFTLIDGIFSTYDFPDSLRTVFFGLNNAGQVVGYYDDGDDVAHGLILQDGTFTQFDFPGAAETQIFGVSEEGQFVGNIVDTDAAIHGFVGEEQIDVPGAATTYSDHVNAEGVAVGSYIDADGMYQGYLRHPDKSFTTVDIPGMPNLEFLYVNAINDAGVVVFRAKAVDDVARTYVLHPNATPVELRFPGSVETVLRDIDATGRIAGYYETPDGRRHGCIASPATQAEAETFSNVYFTSLSSGLNMLSVPLETPTPMTARSLAAMTSATVVIAWDTASQRFIAWTPDTPSDGFPIEGARGYIVNVPQPRDVLFVGAAWANQTQVPAAPFAVTRLQSTPKVLALQAGINTELVYTPQSGVDTFNRKSNEAWAFAVSGRLAGVQNLDGYLVTVRNSRTHAVMRAQVQDGYFAAATADLAYRSVVRVGDTLAVTVSHASGEIASETFRFTVTSDSLANAVLHVTLDGIGTRYLSLLAGLIPLPKQSQLLQNYPNPFNPETWIPYHLSEAGPVSLSIYDTAGRLVRTLSLGYQAAGFYHGHARAAYWDGRNALGEPVASGVYFYQLVTSSFHQTRRMLILK